MVDNNLLLQIIGQLKLQSIPALAVHSLTSSDITYVIYRTTSIGTQNGYPLLKVTGSTPSGAESTVIESGFLILDSSSTYDVKVYDSALITALSTVTFA